MDPERFEIGDQLIGIRGKTRAIRKVSEGSVPADSQTPELFVASVHCDAINRLALNDSRHTRIDVNCPQIAIQIWLKRRR